MKERLNTFFRISVLSLSLLFVFVGLVNAQETTTSGEKTQSRTVKSSAPGFITGTVTAVRGSIIEVLGGAFSLDLSESENKFASTGETILPEMIVAGMQISATLKNVDGKASSNNTLLISKAIVSPAGQGILVGPIQNINLESRSLKLFNRTVLINEGTDFQGSIKKLDDLEVGQTLVVIVQETAPRIVCEQTGPGEFVIRYLESDPTALKILKVSKRKNKIGKE
jgi:hypothetical protein